MLGELRLLAFQGFHQSRIRLLAAVLTAEQDGGEFCWEFYHVETIGSVLLNGIIQNFLQSNLILDIFQLDGNILVKESHSSIGDDGFVGGNDDTPVPQGW